MCSTLLVSTTKKQFFEKETIHAPFVQFQLLELHYKVFDCAYVSQLGKISEITSIQFQRENTWCLQSELKQCTPHRNYYEITKITNDPYPCITHPLKVS